jgi:hypothetical protein
MSKIVARKITFVFLMQKTASVRKRIFAKKMSNILLQSARPNNRCSRFKLRNIAENTSNNCDRLIVANLAAEYDEISATMKFPAEDSSHCSRQCSHFMYESRERRIREGLIKSTPQKRTCI